MGTADAQRVGDKVHSFVLVREIPLLWVDGAIVSAKEVPAEDKVIHKVFDNTAIGTHEAPVDAEVNVNYPYSFNLAAIDTDSLAGVGLDLMIIKFRVSAQEFFGNTGSLTSCVT